MRDGAPLAGSVSLWEATAALPREDLPPGDTRPDVCVIGAGIAGMTTAYLLARAGRSVLVLDDGRIGGGQTQRTTAHLSCAIDDRYVEIERLHGAAGARLAAESHAAAIDTIERIVREERIDCGFTRLDGFLFLGPRQPPTMLDHERDAAHRAGLAGVELLPRVPLPGVELGPCLRFPRQAQFHPLRYLAGLARALRRDGARICTGRHAAKIEGGSEARVATAGGEVIRPRHVVVATNTPVNDTLVIHTKQAPYLTYVIGAIVPRGSLPHVLAWDMLDPYHYVRLEPLPGEDSDVLLVGGEDHKTGQSGAPQACYERLEAWARERFAMILEIRFRWSGQVMETIDGLAFIGRNPMDADNVYIATGDSGMGITHGTIAGLVLSDLIEGRANPWAALYDPARKTAKAASSFARENLNVARQYAEWLASSATAPSAEALTPGQGAILQRGLHKIAAYRDEAGQLHEFSAACPHLGCIVSWNATERSWDCPCHGSRFSNVGRVINGPANHELRRVDPD